MSDNYNVLNYHVPGGSTWVVGGQLTIPSGGVISIADGGYTKLPVSTPTTADTLDVPGVYVLDGSTTVKEYKITDPVVGAEYRVFALNATSSEMVRVSSTAALFKGHATSTGLGITWYGAGAGILTGLTTDSWGCVLTSCTSGVVSTT